MDNAIGFPHTYLLDSAIQCLNNQRQENRFMLPTWFEQATIWLVVIDNSKLVCPAVCSAGEECGLISQTATGNWAYFMFRVQKL